jgi:hypothetical protein
MQPQLLFEHLQTRGWSDELRPMKSVESEQHWISPDRFGLSTRSRSV